MTKDLAFICSLSVSNTIALAILSPTFHDYEDTFADCVVKAVFVCGEKATRPTTHKIKESTKGSYFVKYGHRYYLSDFIRCDICGHCEPHKYTIGG